MREGKGGEGRGKNMAIVPSTMEDGEGGRGGGVALLYSWPSLKILSGDSPPQSNGMAAVRFLSTFSGCFIPPPPRSSLALMSSIGRFGPIYPSIASTFLAFFHAATSDWFKTRPKSP